MTSTPKQPTGLTMTEKILTPALVAGTLVRGSRIGIQATQTLSHDLNVVMTYLALESMEVTEKVVPEAYQYIDHNMIQADYKNADDHRYIMTMAERLGITVAKTGSGICHHLHLELHAKPWAVLIGGDSHTVAAGGIGCFSMGVGGFDNALAIAGQPVYLSMPSIVRVNLTGKLPEFVSAKNVILELLGRVGVKGGVGKIFEYVGEGVSTLSVAERSTITNMGAETGATTSIFGSDENTRAWLAAFDREADYRPLQPDADAHYDDEITIDLSSLVPLVALPGDPGNVVPVTEVAGTPVQQVMIGSCTNTSVQDLTRVGQLLDGGQVAGSIELGIYPSTKTVVRETIQNGSYLKALNAGARMFEPQCGGCNGCGFAPATQSVSLRTTPRNFEGRSGTFDDQIYLAAPEVAAATALTGVITDPRTLGKEWPDFEQPTHFDHRSDELLAFTPDPDVEIVHGPNINPIPKFGAMPDEITSEVVLKAGDNVTTDIICPAGALYLPIRSNIPEIAKVSFHLVDKTFHDRAQALGQSILVAGTNYGQGSSREQAAVIPRYLGINVIIAKGFARLHQANLVNWGVLPLVFTDEADYERIEQGDELRISNLDAVRVEVPVEVTNVTQGYAFTTKVPLHQPDYDAIKVGGTVNQVKSRIDAP